MLKFSVLLSVYRKEQPPYFRQCFDSLMAQSLQPNEIILVKDGELTPELEEVITEYQQKLPVLKTVSLETNQGLGRALNEGLKHCSHELVARMDTDDICKPFRFAKQVEMFENHPEIDVTGTWIDEFDGDINHVVSVRKLPESHEEILRFARRRNPLNHPTVMFRKNKVEQVGGYRHCPLFEDYDLWVRMLQNGNRFYNIPESLLYFRFSPDMFKRRGGWGYVYKEINFQNRLLGSRFISLWTYLQNVCVRMMARVIPNRLRAMLYKKLLRQNK